MTYSTSTQTVLQQARLFLSVILPVHNEENILCTATTAFSAHFNAFVGPQKWQYVFCENGSSDKSARIIEDIIKVHPGSKMIRLARGDYGNALREGTLQADGIWSFILNVDHLWDTPFFRWAWEHRDDYDLILGSKRADPTLNRQDQYRRILSAGLNSLLMYLFDSIVAETHGMKLFRTDRLRPLARVCRMRRGQFDTELTLRTLRGGFWVAEVPLPYQETRSPRNLMLRKVMQNVLDLFRFYRVMKSVPYTGTLRYRRFCREDILPETEKDIHCRL